MELKVQIGAGRGTLRLTDLPLTKLDVQMGAGSATADLRGDWKNNLTRTFKGAWAARPSTYRRNVGVEVYADGGLGSVNAHG